MQPGKYEKTHPCTSTAAAAAGLGCLAPTHTTGSTQRMADEQRSTTQQFCQDNCNSLPHPAPTSFPLPVTNDMSLDPRCSVGVWTPTPEAPTAPTQQHPQSHYVSCKSSAPAAPCKQGATRAGMLTLWGPHKSLPSHLKKGHHASSRGP
jgi:hypothetical protein